MSYRHKYRCVFILIVVQSIYHFSKAEIFSSMSEVEDLLQTEVMLINNLEDYISEQEFKLNYLKGKLAEAHREHNETNTDGNLLNPVNAYHLLRRFTNNWKNIEEIMQQTNNNANISLFWNYTKLPAEDDLDEVAIALTRLRFTYEMDVHSKMNGVKNSLEMSASDCFEIGKRIFVVGDQYYAKQWMNEALNMLNNSLKGSDNISKVDILEYLAIIEFDQTYASLNNIPIYNEPEQRKMYQKLCNDEIKRNSETLAKLKCRYHTDGSLFIKIAPFKLEETSFDPYIVIFHDVIYDQEIEVLKQLAKPKLTRARIGLSLDVISSRTSKNAWFEDTDHEVVRNIGLRVQDMTGLTVTTAEPLQICNYGIGGHYANHVDFFETDTLPLGDRIATVLFYLSDVAQGGATVFPHINVTIKPEKGSAVFWYNLLPSGEGDLSTLHAGCPVLVGSKWVANKWFHERGQEFIRPCGLVPDN